MLPGRSVAISSCIPRMYAVFGFIIAVASGAWPCVPAPRQSSVSVHGHCSFPFFFFFYGFAVFPSVGIVLVVGRRPW